MCRCAKRVAMRRTSWTDQRMTDGALASPCVMFLRWRLIVIGVVADGRHHGKREHDRELLVAITSKPMC